MLIKKSLLATALLGLALTGCSTLKNKPAEKPAADAEASATQTQTKAQETAKAETGAADTGVTLGGNALADQTPADKAAADKAAAEAAAKAAKDKGLQDLLAKLKVRTVYFDYDQSSLQDTDLAVLKAHASYLAKHADAKVRLDGHADERGTPEYNMALGERRANAVALFLKTNGVKDSQLETVSFGEEKPAVDGHDEAAWAKNRRVEIDYTAGNP